MELKTPLKIESDGFGTETVFDAEGERLFVTDDGVDFAVAELVRRANAHDAMVEVLNGYEAIEADIVLTNECWGPDRMEAFPRFTREIYAKWMELQTKRNAALAAAKAEKTQTEGYMDIILGEKGGA